ncbi:hypothetical protein DV451_002608 [Geotrichum candidum]|uniref:Uncharacterized protein n=1 Tax=Geotrichum candidum TaxID=1173061 RepID=A0A9P5KUD8_GEOCN|nr:hypothetical protein DV451_002608 [Geotrichum candidum]KAF5106114.1 hypothetical protein DV453_004231 [Geotrichum candidum]
MARFGLPFKKKRSQHNLRDPVEIPGAPLEAVPECGVSGSSLFSQLRDDTEISSTSSVGSSSSVDESTGSDISYQYQPHATAVDQDFDQRSFESSVATLIFNDTSSTVNTLLDVPSHSSDGLRQPRGSAGSSKVLPIYATRFRSGVQVFESDVAGKVFRTVARSRNKQENSQQQQQTFTGTGAGQIPLPPMISCQTTFTINLFSKKPFMTIMRHGKTLRNPALSSNRPFTLLAEEVHQRQVDLGLLRTAPSNQPTSSDGTSLSPHPGALLTSGTSVTEETGNKPFCTVWQEVVGPDQIKYTLELDEAEFGQSRVVMLNDGRRRITKTSYGGISLQWDGTTGIGSPFGSGYFELRFSDDIISPITGASDAEHPQPQHRRPPIAVYHNAGTKTLAATRKVGEFVIWDPGFEFADLIVAMGLVLREQEQRKEIESHKLPVNKLGTLG